MLRLLQGRDRRRAMAGAVVTLDGRTLSCGQVRAVARRAATAALTADGMERAAAAARTAAEVAAPQAGVRPDHGRWCEPGPGSRGGGASGAWAPAAAQPCGRRRPACRRRGEPGNDGRARQPDRGWRSRYLSMGRSAPEI